MEPRTIVAIEIASSKIKGAIGAVAPDGTLSVLAVEEIPGIDNVRYGRVQNIREVSGAVNEIVRRLEATPGIAPRRIEAMTLSMGGRSLSAKPATARLKAPKELEITESHIERLEYEATRDFMGSQNIEAMVPRAFYVNNALAPKPVGTYGETIRGEFMMVLCGKETHQNLDRLKFDSVERDKVLYEIRPLAMGDFILTPDERQLGCALVDFGAETTTVSVYKDGTLAFLSTIPMGSRLITLDLKAGLSVTEEAAETYKLTLGTLADDHKTDNDKADEINAYVRARAGEIAANILNQIELSGYNADSLSKIVLVGGGSRLPQFASQLGSLCKMPVRVAEMPANVTFRVAGRNNPENIDIVALLSAGLRRKDFNCLSQLETASQPAPAEPEDSFEPVREEAPAHQAPKPRRQLREEDEDLLADDPDTDTDDSCEDGHADRAPKEKTRHGFFGFGRKKERTAHVDMEDDEEDAEDSDKDNEPDTFDVFEGEPDDKGAGEIDPDDDPDHFIETKRAIDKMRTSFAKLFQSDADIE